LKGPDALDVTRILIIEDNPGDARLVELVIREAGDEYFLHWEKDLTSGLERLHSEPFDVVLLDLGLPETTGLGTFTMAVQQTPEEVAIIVLSGLSDEQVAAEAVALGAQDYLVKGEVDAKLLTRSIRYAVERKRYELALRRVNAELEGYAHTVSHDLRSPIGAMALACALLSDSMDMSLEELREEVDSATGTIKRNLAKCSTLIEDLLTLAKAGQRPVEVSNVDIRETVDLILEEKAPQVIERGVGVTIDEDLGTVRASSTHMYQLFLNLISNALEHNDGEGLAIEIRYLGEEGGARKYMVRDNGIGIPPESVDSYLLPFVGGERGGTGIGLSIIKKIVELYGGQLAVSSDGGAVFVFTLKDMES